ncbi:MAG TPA: hypothetical protein VGQ83_05230, partial [Polyangia bacterium]
SCRALLLVALLLAACQPSREAPDPGAAAVAPPVAPAPRAEVPDDAGVIRARIKSTEVVTIDPTPEVREAMKKLDAARAARDRLEAKAPAPNEAAFAAKVAACRTALPTGRVAALPLPRSLPEPPPAAALCQARRYGTKAPVVWYEYATTASVGETIAVYEAALLKRSHTVTRIGRDEGGPGLQFGDIVNGGGLLFASPGSYSIRWEPRSR